MTTIAARVGKPAEPVAPRARRRPRWLGGRWVLPTWMVIVIAWLVAPIIVMAVYGFNDGSGRTVSTTWQGFTFKWYQNLFAYGDLTSALIHSIVIALITTGIATVLGTLMGVALGRWKFRGIGSVNLLLFASIAASEVVLGASLLSMFLTLGIPRGFVTIVLAHVMFSIAYVVVTVRARMSGLDPALEEASRDLGAGPVSTFFRVTLPVIRSGVVAGALLAFALSIDDYIITSFNAGPVETFPLWVWGARERLGGSVPPQVNVMGTLLFLVGVILAIIGAVANRRKA